MSQGNPTELEINTYANEYLLNGGDQSAAWRKAYPKSNASPDSVNQIASRMHAMLKVQSRINQLQDRHKKKDQEEFDITAAEIKKLLHKAVQLGFAENVDAHGNIKPAALAPAVSALGELNKMNGNHAAVKNELSGKDGEPLQIVISGKDAKL